MRLCDLGLDIEFGKIKGNVNKLYGELDSRGIRFRPHFWLSDEWFSPDGVPGIAVPFYLAHPRLIRLERRQMMDVEGGTQQSFMQILRHEAGHALDTAYNLHRRKGYKEVFGNYNQPYPEYYHPKPQSKRFVQHLEPWYAQSHPAEDFAETFAVWLKPRSRWRIQYEGWPAIKKVQFVDQLMQNLPNLKNRSRAKIEPIHRNQKTLREHYAERHAKYAIDCPTAFDRDLKRLFTEKNGKKRHKTAATFLAKNRVEFCRIVSNWTGEYHYNVNQVLREMIDRCRSMKLYVGDDEQKAKQNTLVMLSVHTMNYLQKGHHRVAL